MCAQNARNGKVEAKFCTDGWPDFTTVVCQIFYPKISEVRVFLSICAPSFPLSAPQLLILLAYENFAKLTPV